MASNLSKHFSCLISCITQRIERLLCNANIIWLGYDEIRDANVSGDWCSVTQCVFMDEIFMMRFLQEHVMFHSSYQISQNKLNWISIFITKSYFMFSIVTLKVSNICILISHLVETSVKLKGLWILFQYLTLNDFLTNKFHRCKFL